MEIVYTSKGYRGFESHSLRQKRTYSNSRIGSLFCRASGIAYPCASAQRVRKFAQVRRKPDELNEQQI